MIGVEDLQKIIEAVLFTGYIKGERPLSLLLIAKVGFGKSQLLNRYSISSDGVYYATDITPYALHKTHQNELKSGKIKHIIIPDLLNALNKPKEQAEAFITFFNALIEEGIAKVESRSSDFVIRFPVSIGLITAIAQQDYDRRRHKWATMGFLSRNIIVRYGYSQTTINKIIKSIILREYREDHPVKMEMWNAPQEVTFPIEIGVKIYKIAEKVKDPSDTMGGRKLKQLQRFAMGLALRDHRLEVNNDDYTELERLSEFMEQPALLKVKDGRYDRLVEDPDSYKEL